MKPIIAAILITLAAPAMARPLLSPPSLTDIVHFMEPDPKTFLCYCEYHQPYATLDTAGCDTDAKRAVVGQIVPSSYIGGWFAEGTLWTETLIDLMRAVAADPLNLTIFIDSAYPAYSQSTIITGTIDPGGSYGGCRFDFDGQTAKIADGRLGEFARTALYLADQYDLPMPQTTREHLLDVHYASPPSERELARNIRAWRWNKSWNRYILTRPEESEITRSVQQGLVDFLYKYRIQGE